MSRGHALRHRRPVWVIIERYDSASASSVSVPPENEKAPEAMRTYER